MLAFELKQKGGLSNKAAIFMEETIARGILNAHLIP
jgi:hypothetical protein